MRPIDEYFLKQEEPIRSCLLFLRKHILGKDFAITETWKYGMPFYCYHGKMCCYLWIHKQYKQPYIGVVEGKKIDYPKLLTEKRSRMKIFLVNPIGDLPIGEIDDLLARMLRLYKTT